MESGNRMAVFLLLAAVFVVGGCDGKRVDCRKYVFAPVCRGAAAKRDIQKLEPLLEEPRTPRYMTSEERFPNLDSFPPSRVINDNTVYDKVFLDTFLKKMAPKNTDYDTGTDNC